MESQEKLLKTLISLEYLKALIGIDDRDDKNA